MLYLFIWSIALSISPYINAVLQGQTLPVPSAGKIVRLEQFPSKFVVPRNIDVWLPQGYDSLAMRAQRYSVLYMHDGQMLFDTAITWNKQEWRVDETITELLSESKIRPCIVVGIWNTGKTRHSEYFPAKVFHRLPKEIRDSLLVSALQGKVQSDNYLKFLTQELKPYIDSVFRTYPSQENTFIAGSSMGGLISCYALCEYPQIFGGAACLSTHWVGNVQWQNGIIPRQIYRYLAEFLPQPMEKSKRTCRVYFDYGTATLDSLYKPYQQMVDRIMKKKGYKAKNWQTIEFPGEEHSERAWAKRFVLPCVFLLKKNK